MTASRLGTTMAAALLALLVATSAPCETAPSVVERTAGLIAWYRIDSLHEGLRDGEPVTAWPDESGGGHHLRSDGAGRTLFRVDGLNRWGAVEVGKADTFSVTRPFELDDFTIFLVVRVARPRTALLRSELGGQEGHGLVLRDGGTHHIVRLGNRTARFNAGPIDSDTFTVTVLGRDSGRLAAWVDGEDVSSADELTGPLRVGQLFAMALSRYVAPDGLGLGLTEMIFYDRLPTDEERAAVTAYLADKYGLALPARARPSGGVEAAGVELSSTSQHDLNADGYAIPWDVQVGLGGPFEHDPEGDATRVRCARDATRVRLTVSLPLANLVEGADVRLMILRNGKEFLLDESSTGLLAAGQEPPLLELVTELQLDAGDFVEVVTAGEGAAGEIRLVPERALLRVEVAE